MNVVVCRGRITEGRLQHMTNRCTYSVDLGGCSFPSREIEKELLQTARLSLKNRLEDNRISPRETEFVVVGIHTLEPVTQGPSGNL